FSIASFRDPVTLCLVPLSLTRRSSDLAGAPVAQDGELVLDQGVSQHGEIGEVGVRHAREATSHYATTPRSGTTDRPGALRCGRPSGAEAQHGPVRKLERRLPARVDLVAPLGRGSVRDAA